MEAEAAAAATSKSKFDHSQLVIGDMLARGSEGQVHRGTYKDQPVAVKIIAVPEDVKVEDRALEEDFLRNIFITELNLLRLLSTADNQNVLKFVAAGRKPPESAAESPVFYLVTEYVPQGSLCEFMDRAKHRILPLEKIVAVALDIARGMEFTHAKGVVHRDLKPENILVDENFHMKIADFGAACSEEYCKTATDVAGTYRWMAPEMIRHEPYGKKVDMYSFGLILWELFSGSKPFDDMTGDQVAIAVDKKNLRPPIPKKCPQAMKALIKQCWYSDPNMRPEFSQVIPVLEELQSSLAHKGRLLHRIRELVGRCIHPLVHP